jgi:hypothetical protein
MKAFRKPRCDSYEANLSVEEREELYAWLMEPGLSLRDAQERALPWRGGKRDGKKPSAKAVGKIGRRVRIESAMTELSAAAKVEAAAMARLLAHLPPGSLHEETVDLAMRLISQEVIARTLGGLDPGSRTAAARLMLKRSDQNLQRERFMLEVRKYELATEEVKAKLKEAGPGKAGGVPMEVLDRIEGELKLM